MIGVVEIGMFGGGDDIKFVDVDGRDGGCEDSSACGGNEGFKAIGMRGGIGGLLIDGGDRAKATGRGGEDGLKGRGSGNRGEVVDA